MDEFDHHENKQMLYSFLFGEMVGFEEWVVALKKYWGNPHSQTLSITEQQTETERKVVLSVFLLLLFSADHFFFLPEQK